jgi:hypothetical protein
MRQKPTDKSEEQKSFASSPCYDDPIEWGFGVPSSQVDIDRINREIRGLTLMQYVLYMKDFKTKAPKTFSRYEQRFKDVQK